MAPPTEDVRLHAVISDLHFGDGLSLEDFVYEDAFADFLAYLQREAGNRGGKAELVINGDFVDFLQIEPLSRTPWRAATEKLARVASAHRVAFEALGRFAASGHRIVTLPGNHDIELSFGDVQAALKAHLAPDDPEARDRIVFPDEPLAKHFKGWERGPFAHRLPGVYIEHGNQLDVLNYFDHGDFYEDDSKESVKLPWGSEFVLDVFNEAEAKYRFIDKLRPRSAALLILWLIDPKLVRDRVGVLRALGPRLFPELRRFKRMSRTPAGEGARGEGSRGALSQDHEFLMLLAENADALETIDRHAAYLGATEASLEGSRGFLTEGLSAAYASVFRAALGQLTSKQDDLVGLDEYGIGALELAKSEDAEVVILGHTHGIKDLCQDGARYLNTGTWIGLVDLDREGLAEQSAAEYRALLDRLKESDTFVPLKLLSFVELSYPSGALDAKLLVFRDGKAERP